MSNTFRILQEIVGWIYILVDVAAIGVCLAHVGRSVWARVLAAAFALQLLVGLSYRVATFFTSLLGATGVSAFYLVASLAGLLAALTIVIGLAGLLRQLAGMSERVWAPASSATAAGPVDPA